MQFIFNRFSCLPLLFAVIKNSRAIVGASVRSLAVQLGGVMDFKIPPQQSLVSQNFRVKNHLHGFGMTGFPAADLNVSRVDGFSARVTDNGGQNAFKLAQLVLNALETASGQGGHFRSFFPGFIFGFESQSCGIYTEMFAARLGSIRKKVSEVTAADSTANLCSVDTK